MKTLQPAFGLRDEVSFVCMFKNKCSFGVKILLRCRWEGALFLYMCKVCVGSTQYNGINENAYEPDSGPLFPYLFHS